MSTIELVKRHYDKDEDLENLFYVLRLYLLSDECVCESEGCPVGCEGCMFCMGTTALVNCGEEVFPDA